MNFIDSEILTLYDYIKEIVRSYKEISEKRIFSKFRRI